MIDHHIQREILKRLMHASSLRFSELKPDGMESNIFMYHLKLLTRPGYVEKYEDGYRLAPKGLSYVDSISTTDHRPRLQPKIVVMFVLFDKAGRTLLSKRLVQPMIGKFTFPCGKQHIGETIAEHAEREQKEKLDIPFDAVFRGQFESLIEQEGHPIFHSINYIFTGVVADADIPSPDKRFELTWQQPETLDASLTVPGVSRILELVQQPNDGLFFESLRTSL